MPQTLNKIMEFIRTGIPRQVITLNAEIIYQAQSNPDLLQLINQADLVTPDGAGVVWASRYLGRPVPARVTGIDLVLALGPVAEVKGYRLFLLGAAPGVAEEAGQKLQESYPKLVVAGAYHGYFQPGSPEEQQVLQMIRQAQPDLLLVALGAPRQEFWIRQHLAAGDLTVPVSIGVGGSLDVIAGRVERAPAWMRRCQLEWLGRLLREPRRWRRMLALPKFVLKVLAYGREERRE
jgi:N-acetylglucosaminyldiphosphoundecaprenol N-acetyl-beta-D-mannosaminyltransferase